MGKGEAGEKNKWRDMVWVKILFQIIEIGEPQCTPTWLREKMNCITLYKEEIQPLCAVDISITDLDHGWRWR